MIVEPLRHFDPQSAERAARQFLRALGVGEKALVDAPRRMVDAYADWLTPRDFTPTTFPNAADCDYHDLVIARSIRFASLCEEHVLPFVGVAHVGYQPGDRVIGLSKLARVVDFYSRQLQSQQRLTNDVLGWVNETLHPGAAGVVIEAQHLCERERPAATVVTSAFSGELRTDAEARREFLSRCR
jgi:GTP cyclohydrolase I